MDLAKELRALEALSKMVKAAEDCRNLFDEAGMAYPEPLRRLLGLMKPEDAGMTRREPSIQIPPPDVSRPPGVADGWIYVPKAALTPQTVVLGLLREVGVPLPVKQVVTAVRATGCEANDGSIANIGTRLASQGVITRSDSGWSLVDKEKAPILNGKYAWGTADMFMKQEVAARRRDAILHMLKLFPAGLMSLQIVEQLEGCAWLKTPLSKDLVKMDMEDLKRDGLVRRSGTTKKWVLAEGNED